MIVVRRAVSVLSVLHLAPVHAAVRLRASQIDEHLGDFAKRLPVRFGELFTSETRFSRLIDVQTESRVRPLAIHHKRSGFHLSFPLFEGNVRIVTDRHADCEATV